MTTSELRYHIQLLRIRFEEVASWTFIKRSLEGIVNDSATQRENLSILRTLKQDDKTINDYLTLFKTYLKRTKKNALYEAKDPDIIDEVVEIFIQGLDADIVMPAGPYDSLEAARDAAVSVMKYNKRRGAEEKSPTRGVDQEEEHDLRKQLKELRRKMERQQLDQIQNYQEALHAPTVNPRGGFGSRRPRGGRNKGRGGNRG